MSEMPPPPPNQPAQPPMGGAPSSAGSNKNLFTILAWALLPPIGSLVFLFVGKDDPDVKYNAALATVIHGGAFAIWIILRILTVILLPIAFLLIIWDLVWFVMWLIGLILSLQAHGARVSYPVVGTYAKQYVPTVEAWAK